MLQTRFDELRMLETETLFEFYEKLSDIANQFFALGEKIDESVLVRKIVHVLPDRFDTKFLAMEEAKDFGKMKVEELMVSLGTFELNQQIKQKGKPNPSIEKSKGIAFKVYEKDVYDDGKDDEMTLITRNFQKFMKKVGNKKNFSKTPKGNTSSKPFVSNNKKGIKCRECEGYRHIQSKCANTLKKNKKGFNVTWNDDDSEGSEEDNEKVALTSVLSTDFQERGKILCLNNTLTDVNKKEIDLDSDESELNEESLAESYKDSVFTAERSVSIEMKQSGKPENSHGKNKCFIPSCHFYGGCSRHMIGDKDLLVNIRLMQCGEDTFGNGLAGNVIGKGTLNFVGLPRLKNVMLVEGICDKGYTVNFDSNRCYVANDQDEIILQGFRYIDNCYTLTTYATCHSAIDNSTDLWHEKLGHIHFKNLKKLSNAGIVRGLPKLGKESVGKCEPYQLRKQLKISHKSILDVNTSKVLELLHMDLMGPIQVESLNDCNIGKIVRIRSDHGKEFENSVYDEFCKSKEEKIEGLLEKSPELADDLAAITESSSKVTPQDSVATTNDFLESSTKKETEQLPNIITDPIQREPSSRVKKNHPTDLILGNMHESMVTRRRYANLIQFVCFVSSLEPKNVKEALMDEAWIRAMQEELDQFIHNKVRTLVPRPTCANVIGTK
ncbi:uncharacterized protein LOC133779758 [Humulus lupulus]|uniref:uncharacterized protein LOC133779758 n=1 Tax=Humulus lupulus TaxID=3486 RepID=UPI002B404DDB|nr:uncharacterized protein LOC133779758 [Humulus lupulus]